MKAKALGTGLEGIKSTVKVEGTVGEYQSSPHLTDQEHEAQGISIRPILWKSHPLCEKNQGHSPIAFFVKGKRKQPSPGPGEHWNELMFSSGAEMRRNEPHTSVPR